MTAAKTVLPVIGVPVESKALQGMDSLLSIVQMPGGVPVATVAIGKSGALNAGLLAGEILGIKYPEYRDFVRKYKEKQTKAVSESRDPRV